MKISIITVVYNDAQNIGKTIKSILEQTYKDIEYIIVDGGSTDGTIEVINQYLGSIDIVISEADKGIYDAMNKGIKAATGEYCCFMNSNDLFANKYVLAEVFNTKREEHIIYGDTIIQIDNCETVVKPLPLNMFWKRIPICHQSSFIKTDIQKRYLYNLNYKVSSIYDFFYKCYINGYDFSYVELPISKYDQNGYSSYAFSWLHDYIRISWKYSKRKRIYVLGKIFTYFISRSIAYLKHKI